MKKTLSILMCLLLIICSLSITAYAANDCSLTIIYRDNSESLVGADIDIYRVGDINDDGFVLSADFADSKVDLNASQKKAAAALNGYAVSHSISPDKSGTTNANGIVYYPNLEKGLYLAVIHPYEKGNSFYAAGYYLISLPGTDEETQNIVYDVVSVPKVNDLDKKFDLNNPIDIHVLKVWDDKSESTHSTITVDLYCDGKYYESADLTQETSWRHIFEGLEAKHEWVVVEKNVPEGYKVSVDINDFTYTITNSGSSPDKPIIPDIPPELIIPLIPIIVIPSVVIPSIVIPSTVITTIVVTVVVSIPVIGLIINHVTGHEITHPDLEPTNPEDSDKLPNTGASWLPVPVLAAAGILLITLGVKKKKENKSADITE